MYSKYSGSLCLKIRAQQSFFLKKGWNHETGLTRETVVVQLIQEVKDFTLPRAGAKPSRWVQHIALDRSTYSHYNSLPKWAIWNPESQAQYASGSGHGQEMWWKWSSHSQGRPTSQCHQVSSSKSEVQQKRCASKLSWNWNAKMNVIGSLCFSSRCNLRCPCFSHVCLKFPCMGGVKQK